MGLDLRPLLLIKCSFTWSEFSLLKKTGPSEEVICCYWVAHPLKLLNTLVFLPLCSVQASVWYEKRLPVPRTACTTGVTCVLVLRRGARVNLWNPNESFAKMSPPFDIPRKSSIFPDRPTLHLPDAWVPHARVSAWRTVGLLAFETYLWPGRRVGPNLAKAMNFLCLHWDQVRELRDINVGRLDSVRTTWLLFCQGSKAIVKAVGSTSVLSRDFLQP